MVDPHPIPPPPNTTQLWSTPTPAPCRPELPVDPHSVPPPPRRPAPPQRRPALRPPPHTILLLRPSNIVLLLRPPPHAVLLLRPPPHAVCLFTVVSMPSASPSALSPTRFLLPMTQLPVAAQRAPFRAYHCILHYLPVGLDATEFTNFIGTLVRKHIPPAELGWRDVDVEKKLLVWETLKAFYDLDSSALSFVINTSHIKWKDWKSDLKRHKFDAALTDAQLMKRCDSRISEADWKTLITYWRSSVFESRSAIVKRNRANAVPHTSGSKSHARVVDEMAVKLGHEPRRDQVYIETHTCKKGDRKGSYVPQGAATIKTS